MCLVSCPRELAGQDWACGVCPPAQAAGVQQTVHLTSLAMSAGSDALTMDFATVVHRLQLLGFNAVRLPFSFQNLYDEQPQSQIRNCANVGYSNPLLPVASHLFACCRTRQGI